MPWDRLCNDFIGPYNIKSNIKGVKIPPLKCVTMINLATGWFEIKQYDDQKSITVTTCLVPINIFVKNFLTVVNFTIPVMLMPNGARSF
jgi:hypothetical protein